MSDNTMFTDIITGLQESIEYVQGDNSKGKSRIREQMQVKPIKEYSSLEIKTIRLANNLTQKNFADVLGVSIKTIEAWENGRNKPAGSSARLLEILEHDHNFLNDYNIVVR